METILKVENITKKFPGVLAVDSVSLSLNKGEILSLIGENGAGKSTLTNIIGGVYRADNGEIKLEDKRMSFTSSHDAIQAGIAMVFQELSLVGNLSVAENIFANRQPIGKLKNIRWKKLFQESREFLQRFSLDIDPRTLVKDLSLGKQQILEILKAISTNPTVLILDEPTTSLTDVEINYLFENINQLQKQGISVIYISHKLSEVFQIANRVMVMRDGKHVDTKTVAKVTEQDLVNMMVGRKIKDIYGVSAEKKITAEYFRVTGFNRENVFHDVSFGLKKGEILGFAGLVGAGRTELGRSIFGIDPKNSGTLNLEGKQIQVNFSADAIKNGISYLTEDRTAHGLFLNMAIRDNLIAPSLIKYSSSIGFLNKNKITENAHTQVETYSIATSSILQKVLNLSGGNQQKCLIGMWMGINPNVIIFDEPTRGVDVGARSEIYQKMKELSSLGTGIIMISSDLPELIGMCDRILVMRQGRIAAEIMPEDFSEELILSYAAGVEESEVEFSSLEDALREELIKKAKPTLDELRNATSQTIHMAVMEGTEVVFIHKIQARRKVQMMSRVGRRAPSYCTGVGKTILAWAPEHVVDKVSKKLVRYTGNTITDDTLLKVELKRIAENGYAIDNEEHEEGIRCVSAPIRDKDEDVVAAVSITTSMDNVKDDQFASFKKKIIASAETISRLMGYK